VSASETIQSKIPQFVVTLALEDYLLPVPLSSVDIVYSIVRNGASLPQANVAVVVGRDAETGEPAAQLGDFLNIAYGTPAKIQFALSKDEEPFTIFDGYIRSVSPYRSDAAYGISIGLNHWLARLDGSSAYFGNLSNNFPLQLDRTAATNSSGSVIPITNVSRFSNEVSTYIFSSARESATGPGLDLWSLFRGTLKRAAAYASRQGGLADLAPNKAVDLLDNILGRAYLNRVMALALVAEGDDNPWATTMAQIALSSAHGAQTLLSKVLYFLDLSGCVLLPAVGRAAVAPNPALAAASVAGATLDFDGMVAARSVFQSNKNVYGCYMLGAGADAYSNAAFQQTASSQILGRVLAAWPPGDVPADGNGVLISVDAPPWLKGQTPRVYRGLSKIGRNLAAAESPRNDVTLDETLVQQAAENYCKYAMAVAKTRGSSIEITTPLDFSIGPGTVVNVNMGDESQEAVVTSTGFVEAVRLNIDAAAARTYTSFTIGGVSPDLQSVLEEDEGARFSAPPMHTEYVGLWEL